MSDDEVFTPREVLDGKWVSCWEALQIVEDQLRDHAVETTVPVGKLLARMASTGYLPTISNDISHTMPIEPGEKSVLQMNAAEKDEYYKAAKERLEEVARGEGRWALVSPRLWAAILGQSPIPTRRVQHADISLKLSAITAVFTEGTYEHNAPLWKVMGDPGYYMLMARNILVYREGLHSAQPVIEGWASPDDKFAYEKCDLSKLDLPDKTPMAETAARFKPADTSAETSSNGGGRRAGTNGTPIAAYTIKLMKISDEELRHIKLETATSELMSLYSMHAGRAPHPDNCRKDARGILQQVRGARGLS